MIEAEFSWFISHFLYCCCWCTNEFGALSDVSSVSDCRMDKVVDMTAKANMGNKTACPMVRIYIACSPLYKAKSSAKAPSIEADSNNIPPANRSDLSALSMSLIRTCPVHFWYLESRINATPYPTYKSVSNGSMGGCQKGRLKKTPAPVEDQSHG